jgi:alpha-amylase/alpha-mannosidase (GH57 family)
MARCRSRGLYDPGLMERFICIHGHFYQPPRENPWLEAVETQDSAHPYHDWNERITEECYEPNATSRMLDAKDRILRIVNNYSSISFNYGPTLLSWMETRAPETYAAIIEADRASRARFSGHGSAIAQAYNHIILPLANERDQKTQVRWGIRDFESRFGRKPEAMWLPETAVDIDSLEALAAEGIRYTILEPQQAARYRTIGSNEWTASNGWIDPTMPYRCTLPSGRTIAIFFFDGPISRAVAFEQLLARGENLAHRLTDSFSQARNHPELVNIATDGETYGHHHRYGDMALAYALEYIEAQGLAKLTNYGEFLEKFPPTHEVEIVERTAWSCAHGVERWRSDCGCNTGSGPGWNQQWRTPLRYALDWLRDEVEELFEHEASTLLTNPWAARDAYIDVILDRSEDRVQNFMRRWGHQGMADDPARVTAALELLEMQRNAMLMYTSCGWFFNDISGIETVQILDYAARVVQLAERFGMHLDQGFAERLGPARSNIPEQGTGRDLYERESRGTRLDLTRVAAHYAVASLFDTFDDDARIYCYDVTRSDFDIEKAGRSRLAIARITVRSLITSESGTFEFAVLHLGETELTGGVRFATSDSDYEARKKELLEAMEPGSIPAVIRLLDQHFSNSPLSIRSLFRDEQRRIFHMLCNATLEEAESAFRQLHERYDPLMRFHARLGIPIPKVLQMAAEFDLNVQFRHMLEDIDIPLAEVESLLREVKEEKVVLDPMTLMSFEHAVNRTAERFLDRPDDIDRLELYDGLVTLIRDAKLDVSLRRAENIYYRLMNKVRPAVTGSATANGPAAKWLALFDGLGEKLSISQEARIVRNGKPANVS